ncbi:ubiquinone-dependent pyruvate dehydrogenase, partial [Corynebacterium diphtheriae]
AGRRRRGVPARRRLPGGLGLPVPDDERAPPDHPLAARDSRRRYLDKALKHYAKTRKDLDQLATPGRGRVHPQYVARLLDELADDDVVFLPDVGSPVVWASRYLTMNGRRRII